MSRITIDRDACDGYGNCVLAAASHFDLDEDDIVVALQSSVVPGELEAVRKAAISCPVGAIRIEDD